MHLMYDQADSNEILAQGMYQDHFPRRLCLHYTTFMSIDQCLGEARSFWIMKLNTRQEGRVCTPELENPSIAMVHRCTEFICNEVGGVDRDWVGVPREFHIQGQDPRCVCVKNYGPPSTDSDSTQNSNNGDLDYPLLKEYPGCLSTSESCAVSHP
ncbi:hypothetical protein TNIN_245691 [Trichonephila inaurata madagascariensis]|uniref:Uncharacterized protein n=1 Tax=Trichonephila inaurata madagascariensis TaxID=2747483 RepID=A0A8X6MBB7_9ARAC|nr:hypothetical protein TNIN_245691 [Trichonephila inaurata madagascariensis]